MPGPIDSRTVLVVLLALGIVGEGHASITTPSGLSPGDQFRVVFVSTTQSNATSANISFYDNIVQADAAGAGLSTYGGSPVTWEVIGSTATINAVSRLPLDNVPIFLPSGTEVAAGGAALWNTATTPLLSPINEYASGIGPVTTGMFTGTTSTGTAVPGLYLGVGSSSTTYVEDGRSDFTTPSWVALGETFAVGQESYYAFSQVLTVIPEPGEQYAEPGRGRSVGWIAMGAPPPSLGAPQC